MKIYRTDRKAIAALGGRDAMRAYPVADWSTKGRGKWRKYSPLSWIVPDDAIPQGITPQTVEQASDTARKRHTAGKKARATAVARATEIIGALPTSRTVSAYLRGELELDDARRIAETCRQRHEETDYDDLLAAGVPKDVARETMRRVEP